MPAHSPSRRGALRFGALAVSAVALSRPAWSQQAVSLFKIVTVKDDIVIGLDKAEIDAIGGGDAGAVARALAAKGQLTVWQYGVRRGANGEPVQAPVAKIGLLAHASLRVEPYKSPYPIAPHD